MKFFDDVQKLSCIEDGLLGIEKSNHSDGVKKFDSIDKLG